MIYFVIKKSGKIEKCPISVCSNLELEICEKKLHYFSASDFLEPSSEKVSKRAQKIVKKIDKPVEICLVSKRGKGLHIEFHNVETLHQKSDCIS